MPIKQFEKKENIWLEKGVKYCKSEKNLKFFYKKAKPGDLKQPKVTVSVLVGSKTKSDIEEKIDKGKNPPGGLRAKGLRKLKEKITGKSKGGMAKRKAKK